MVLHNRRQRRCRPVGRRVRQPVRQLVVPHQVVAAHDLAVGLGEREEVVAAGVVEDALFGLGGIPFHDVGWRQLAEVFGVVQLGHIVRVLVFACAGDVRGGAEVALWGQRFGGFVEADGLGGRLGGGGIGVDGGRGGVGGGWCAGDGAAGRAGSSDGHCGGRGGDSHGRGRSSDSGSLCSCSSGLEWATQNSWESGKAQGEERTDRHDGRRRCNEGIGEQEEDAIADGRERPPTWQLGSSIIYIARRELACTRASKGTYFLQHLPQLRVAADKMPAKSRILAYREVVCRSGDGWCSGGVCRGS